MNNKAESGQLLGSEVLPGGWQVHRLRAPSAASRLLPGQQLQAGGRHLPVMLCDKTAGTVSVVTAPGSNAPEQIMPVEIAGDPLLLPEGPLLLIAEDAGLFAAVHCLQWLKSRSQQSSLALLGMAGAFPFRPAPSRLYLPDMPPHVIATMPLLDDWGVPARLAHADNEPGCFEGTVTAFAGQWLTDLDPAMRQATRVLLLGAARFCERASALLDAHLPSNGLLAPVLLPD